MNFQIFFFVLLALQATKTNAATCCGSNFSAPALMTTGEKFKFQLAETFSRKDFFTNPSNQTILLEEKKSFQKMNFKFGIKGTESTQFFLESSFSGKDLAVQSLGDTIIGTGFLLSERDLTQQWGYMSLSLPTGTPLSKITDPYQPATGTGVFALAFGGFGSQIYPWGDTAIGLHFSENIQDQNFQDHGMSFFAGIGRSLDEYRFGTSVSSHYQSGTNERIESYWQSLSFQFSIAHQQSLWAIVYSDDSLIGPARNTFLTKNLTFNFINRWF